MRIYTEGLLCKIWRMKKLENVLEMKSKEPDVCFLVISNKWLDAYTHIGQLRSYHRGYSIGI